jgi:hypothetical protein
MAKRFVGAGFLEQKSVGHGSYSAASRCTADAMRSYFQDLKIPDGSLEDETWKTCSRMSGLGGLSRKRNGCSSSLASRALNGRRWKLSR